MSTVTLPGLGKVPKPAVIAGAGITAGILVYAYYRRAHSTGSAAGGDTSQSGAAAAGDAVDPSTGLPYSEESTGAGVGYGQPGYGGFEGGYDPYASYGYPYTYPGSGSTSYSSNYEWEAAAVGDLADAGVTTTTASSAISRVLGGLTVTTKQKEIFLQAVGLVGNPPNGYPTPIHVVDTPAQPASGSKAKPGKVGGLHTTSVTSTSIRIDWNAVSGASGYHVDVNGHRRTSVEYSVYSISGLKPNTHYSIGITANNSAGDGPTSVVHVTTHKK